MIIRFLITYYHESGCGVNLTTTVIQESLESFVKVLLTSGYHILSIE